MSVVTLDHFSVHSGVRCSSSAILNMELELNLLLVAEDIVIIKEVSISSVVDSLMYPRWLRQELLSRIMECMTIGDIQRLDSCGWFPLSYEHRASRDRIPKQRDRSNCYYQDFHPLG